MSVRANIAVLLFGIVLAVTGARAISAAASAGSLDQALAILQDAEFVDLTHEFSPTTPHWKGFAPETVTTLFTIAKEASTPRVSAIRGNGARMSIHRRISMMV